MNYPKKGLSIDLGNDKIKIIEYKRNRDKIKIIKSLLLDTPDNCLDDGMVVQMDTLSEFLRDQLRENGIKEKKAIFTVASSKIITREVDLPDLPKKKLDALTQMNAEEYFPVDLSEYTIDYRILDHYVNDEDKMIRVNMVAAFTELIECYINLAGLSGLKVCGVDFAGNSIVNYATHMKKEGTYLLLDLGSKSTMVTIMNEGSVRFNRNLVYGTQVVVNCIQNHFSVRYKEAVKISSEQSLLLGEDESEDLLRNEVTSALNQVMNGVLRLVDFYTSRNKDGVDKIYLVGGGTKIVGIEKYISTYFNIETELVKQIDDVAGVDETFVDEGVFYANAIGAIYSEMNLLPFSFLNKDKEKASDRLKLEVGILLLLLVGGAMYMSLMTIRNLEADKQVLLDEIDEKSNVVEIKAAYDLALAKEAFYTEVNSVSGSTTEVLLKLMEKMETEIPSDVDFLSLNNNEDGVVISCITSDKKTLIKFITILSEMTLEDRLVFSRVYVPSFTNPEAVEQIGDMDLPDEVQEDIEEAYYTFSIICDYNKEVE